MKTRKEYSVKEKNHKRMQEEWRKDDSNRTRVKQNDERKGGN